MRSLKAIRIKNSNQKLVIVTVKMPLEMLERLDMLVRKGKFVSRSDAIRRAVSMLLEAEGESLST